MRKKIEDIPEPFKKYMTKERQKEEIKYKPSFEDILFLALLFILYDE